MAPSRGRPRDPHTDELITQATLELLRERGPSAVHVDTVAARSGVARTTIYRRFRDREALIRAALAGFSQAPLPREELPLEEKLRWELEQVDDLVQEQLGRGGIAAVLADSDPTFSTALRALLVGRLTALQAEIEADVGAGHLRKGTDAASLGTLLFGAYLGELLQHGRPRPGWADAIVDLLVRGLRGTHQR
jgi:AcrR family transcriptional regulator